MAFSIKRAFLALAVLVASASSAASAPSAHNLPIFFFHGINGNAANGDVLKANLSTEARPLVALSACETVCTLSNLNTQAALATKQIRELIANDTRFANGYVFVAHSLGAAVARAVIETMDDHKVHTFISLAGAVNGLAFGAQPADSVPAQLFLKNYAPIFYGATPFNYSSYTIADLQSGKFQVALSNFLAENPQLQVTSGIQLVRSPVQAQWIQYNSFYAPLNNLPPATSDAIKEEQARRKRNFLKLSAAHFFASSFDETIAPWQAAQLGQYQAVASVDEYAAKFSQLPVVSAQETVEYKQDTYGLKTLDERKGLFFHTIDNVPHSSWIKDSTSPRDGKVYAFAPVYEKGLYPILAPEPTKDAPAPKPNC